MAAVAVTASATAAPQYNDGRTKNVIYVLGDDMGRTHGTPRPGALLRRRGEAGQGNPASSGLRRYVHGEELGPAQPLIFTPNPVTDSASAPTAWASGVKTYNAALGVDAKGAVVPTMMELGMLAVTA